MSDAIENEARYIGGWFAIQLSLEALDSDQRFARGKEVGDVSYRPLSVAALENLAQLLPDARIPYSAERAYNPKAKKTDIAAWKRYIEVHKAEIQERYPPPDSTVFSKCSQKN